MEKNWFILGREGDRHTGPFSSPEIVRLFVGGQVYGHDLLWKDGEADWRPLQDFPELATMIEFQSTSLDMNDSDLALAKHRKRIRRQEMAKDRAHAEAELLKKWDCENIEGGPPPLPAPARSENTRSSLPSLPPISLSPLSPPKKAIFMPFLRGLLRKFARALGEIAPKKYILGGLSLSMVIITSFYFLKGDPWDQWLKNYPKARQTQFLKIFNSPEKLAVTFYWDREEKQLYGALNHSEAGKFTLELRSLKGRVMADGPIIIKTQGEMAAHQMHFAPVELVSGLSIPFGHYSYTLKGHYTGVWAFIAEFFKFKGPGRGESFYKAGEVVFYPKKRADFDKKLASYTREKKQRTLLPLQELLQSYQTFRALLSEVTGRYRVHLDALKKGHQIKKFEGQYMKKIGPLLQGLILDSDRMGEKWQKKKSSLAGRYNRLADFGKKITGLALEMSQKTRAYKRAHSQNKAFLKTYFVKKEALLQQMAKSEIETLTKEISLITSQNGEEVASPMPI